MKRPRRKLAMALWACLLATLCLPAGGASGEISSGEGCEYVEAGPPGPEGNRLVVVGYGEPELRRHGRELVVDEGPPGCGRTRVTVDSVDRIVFKTEGESVTLDESGGPFAPGATPERLRPEIEIEIREPRVFSLQRGPRDSATRIGVGPGDTVAFNLDPTAEGRQADWDVTISKGELRRIKVFAERGEDLIDARRMTGIPDNQIGFPTIRLRGGPGRDTILGGPEVEELFDGPGSDLIRAGGGADAIAFGPGRDSVYGGPGGDGIFYEFIGIGRRSPDAPDRLFGGPGPDILSDRNSEPDLLDCGGGSDAVEREGRDRLGPGCERYRPLRRGR